MRGKEPSIPISVLKLIIQMQQDHMTEVTRTIGQHLERVAELYERALNPPLSSGPVSPMWVSEEEEDEKYASLSAEMEALRDLALEKGLDLGDLQM
jgi:hypothetical protein